MSHGKRKDYKVLLVGLRSTVGVDKVPMQKKYEKNLECDTDFDKKLLH